jgi:hypothetical protein
MAVKKKIDEKHHINDLYQIIKSSNGEAIPEDEPVILFRGRDKLSLPTLKHYRELCVEDECTEYQLKVVDVMIEKFEKFSETSSTMKQPGITEGK